MEINWLTAPEMDAWRAYIETYADLANALERDLSEFDLTLGDYQLLVYLSEAPDQAMRMCDLAEMLQLSPSGLTRRLDGLVATGCVVRQASPVDRRVMMGVLTEAGRELLERAAPAHVVSVRHHIFDHLDREQVAALESIFTSIADGLRRSSADEAAAEAVA